jgi:hypothetical protein
MLSKRVVFYETGDTGDIAVFRIRVRGRVRVR